MIKVRLQLLGEGTKGAKAITPLHAARMVVAEEGFMSLYNGISAAWLRQASYTTLRLGFFDRFLEFFTSRAHSHGRETSFVERAMASLSAGGLAAAIANPAEVGLIRMQSDGMKPRAQRANYTSVADALSRISKAEGVSALWQGSYPTIIRAMATNFGQLAFFSESKAQLAKTRLSEMNKTIAASAIAGFFAAFFSLPFDFLKTRLQRGGGSYSGMFDCAVKVSREEGVLRFYRGFGTYFARIAPHSFITLIIADNLKAAWVAPK
jgi:solute carrier family 25 oxoglutarate transporter 11